MGSSLKPKSSEATAKTEIQYTLYAHQDKTYQAFYQKLLPSIQPERIIGVRTPQLRKLAKLLHKNNPELALSFLHKLPHQYIEEDSLHGFLLEQIKDSKLRISLAEDFLCYLDNWATCDGLSTHIWDAAPELKLQRVYTWLKSSLPYQIRYGIVVLLKNYLDEHFSTEHLRKILQVHSDEYYVQMAIAWLFAEALAKQYAATIPFLQEPCLNLWCHNKVIQKARESRRISPTQKAYLASLKR